MRKGAAEVVEKHAHREFRGAVPEQIGTVHRDVVVVEDEDLHVDRFAGRCDLIFELGKKCGAVDQVVEFSGDRAGQPQPVEVRFEFRGAGPRWDGFGQGPGEGEVVFQQGPAASPVDRLAEPESGDRLPDHRFGGGPEGGPHEVPPEGGPALRKEGLAGLLF